MLSTHFDMKDLGEASYVLGIKILRDRANGVLKLSQRAYIEKILKRAALCMLKYVHAPILLLLWAFGKVLEQSWVLRYLQGTKDLMLTYQRTSLLDVVGFCDADFAGCIDDKKSTTGYIFMMAGGAVSWKVSSRHLQHPQLWRQSMWHVMRLVVMLCGCGILFQL
ncbi:hypothetical protein CK203_024166 [Vitis vinifera]|uniref:Reverse transcriptase Ty1/copia-type domain-containing protein n=1 Tax=Vitis vinifera TaxID=29760 RepID=A0A438I4H9_VITVI|nr:hypothetical protein CK203_024166 [Vitis vinifera]